MSENDALQVSCCGRHGIVGCERCFGPYRVVRPMVRRTERDELRAERDSRDATIAQLKAWNEETRVAFEEVSEERDSLSASLEAKDAELAELRARVEAAVAGLRELYGPTRFAEPSVYRTLVARRDHLLAILAPPEGEEK